MNASDLLSRGFFRFSKLKVVHRSINNKFRQQISKLQLTVATITFILHLILKHKIAGKWSKFTHVTIQFQRLHIINVAHVTDNPTNNTNGWIFTKETRAEFKWTSTKLQVYWTGFNLYLYNLCLFCTIPYWSMNRLCPLKQL